MATINSVRTGDWFNPSTWDSNSVPTSTDDVILNHPVRANSNITVGSIINLTTGGGELIISTNLTITCTGTGIAGNKVLLISPKTINSPLIQNVGGVIFPPVLDDYPNADAAYSVKKLSNNYSGSCIRVRRVSDNSEIDVGFVNDDLDTITLSSFCSGTNGFVTRWYDQSGNENNVVNTSASNQPQIVSGGTILTDNGVPCLFFDGVNDFLDNNNVSPGFGGTDVYFSGYIVCKSTDTLAADRTYLSMGLTYSNNPFMILGKTSLDTSITNIRDRSLVQNSVTAGPISTQSLISFITNGDSSTCRINGAPSGANTASLGERIFDRFSIGSFNRASRAFYWLGNIQEVIIYQSNLTTFNSGIESNINSYYNIY
jgi:hypothetical protein